MGHLATTSHSLGSVVAYEALWARPNVSIDPLVAHEIAAGTPTRRLPQACDFHLVSNYLSCARLASTLIEHSRRSD
ncbi:hypothetical protein BS330_12810 [Amycolatopsis keratiniphila subsp. nogabecina]|nr:hypothetical protein BS330_12810 [Amycolatopsis keratiniphila subsp. nogabecina]